MKSLLSTMLTPPTPRFPAILNCVLGPRLIPPSSPTGLQMMVGRSGSSEPSVKSPPIVRPERFTQFAPSKYCRTRVSLVVNGSLMFFSMKFAHMMNDVTPVRSIEK